MSPRRSRRGDGAFKIVQRTVGERTVLVVRGNLDNVHAPELGRAVHRALASRPQHVVIDLCQVPFVDYRGLSVLLNARRRAQRLRIEISLACDVPRTLRLLERMRLHRAFHIHTGDGL
jgi:anti-sigma B factor antagonist